MSRNQALEKVGIARVAYKLQQLGWLVGEAFEDGYDLLVVFIGSNHYCQIELKTMDLDNRSSTSNLTAPLSPKERESCIHIIVYLEPEGRYFIARKDKVLTKKENIYAATDEHGVLRNLLERSFSFSRYEDKWEELKYK